MNIPAFGSTPSFSQIQSQFGLNSPVFSNKPATGTQSASVSPGIPGRYEPGKYDLTDNGMTYLGGPMQGQKADLELRNALATMQAKHGLDSQTMDNQNQFDWQKSLLGADMDWRSALLGSKTSLTNTLLGAGKLSSGTISKAKANYGPMLGDIKDLQGRYKNLSQTGLFQDGELDEIRGMLNPSLERLTGTAQNGALGADEYDKMMALFNSEMTGGVEGIDMSAFMDKFNPNYDALSNMRNNGKYSQQEMNDIIATEGAEIGDAGRANAENVLNERGGPGTSSFAAAVLGERANTAEGRARAGANSRLKKEQADSKFDAANSLNSLIGEYGNVLGMDANARAQGAGRRMSAISSMADFINTNARSKMEAESMIGDIAKQMSGLLGQHASGRLQGMAGESGLLELLSGISGNMAELDTREVQPWESEILDGASTVGNNIKPGASGYGPITGPGSTTTSIRKGGGTITRRKLF